MGRWSNAKRMQMQQEEECHLPELEEGKEEKYGCTIARVDNGHIITNADGKILVFNNDMHEKALAYLIHHRMLEMIPGDVIAFNLSLKYERKQPREEAQNSRENIPQENVQNIPA